MSTRWQVCIAMGLVLVGLGSASEAQMTVMLKSEKGYVGTAISGRVEAHDDRVNRSCVFYLEDHGDAGNGERYVALKDAYSNKYLVGQDDGSVYSNRDQRGAWETWTMIDNGNGTFAFRSDSGKYLVADEDHALRANRDGIGPWESFAIERAQHKGCWDEAAQQEWETNDDGSARCGLPALIDNWACGTIKSASLKALFFSGPRTLRDCPGDPTGLTKQALCFKSDGSRNCETGPSPIPFFAPPWQTRTFDQNPTPMIVGGDAAAEFDGQTSLTIGRYRLPSAFFISMDIDQIDSVERWRHLLELGAVEHGWNAPLRIETGEEGELYVALGNGSASVEATFEQVWSRGSGVQLEFAYDHARRAGNLYGESGYIGTLVADLDPSAVDGTLIAGSHKGTERFFEGQVNAVLVDPNGRDAGRNPGALNLRSGWLGFGGSRALNVSQGGIDYMLSDQGNFTVKAEVLVNASSQWNHLIELGTPQYGWNAPLRIEIGNAGEWYVAMGDGSAFTEQVFQGSWSHGDWVNFHFSFDSGSQTGSFYENGVHLGDMQVPTEGVSLAGQLILGGYRGQDRFFSGEMRNLYIGQGASAP